MVGYQQDSVTSRAPSSQDEGPTFLSGKRIGGSLQERHFAPQDSRIALSAVANLERGLDGARHVQISAPEIKNSLNGVNGRQTTQSPLA